MEKSCSLPAGEHRLKARLDQDALHFFALVALDFDAALFHRPADAAGFLHLSGEFLFLWQANPREIAHDRYGLAAAMRGLNTLHNAGLTKQRMAELLAEIGSDIPFFVYGRVCDCEGRGENVTPVDWDYDVGMLLLKPSFGVSTPAAYEAWLGAEEIPGVDYSAQKMSWGEMVNDLEKPVFMKHRFLAEMKMWLLAQPEVEAAMMSGSGSTFMAILSRSDADAVLARARNELDPTLWGEFCRIELY